jgi:cytochrome c
LHKLQHKGIEERTGDFMPRRAALILVFALAACGPMTPPTSTSAETSTTVVAQALTPEQIATATAALHAPYSQGNYEAGRRVFAQCRSCHTLDAGAGNRVGPNLHGLVGRDVGTVEGFSYSDALKHADFTWDADHLDHWIAGPQADLPGNRMAFVGVRDATQRRDLITYLLIETGR